MAAMIATIPARRMKIFQWSKFGACWSSHTTERLKVKAASKEIPITKKRIAATRLTNWISPKC